MVRLRREIEGVRPLRGVPLPPYALVPEASAQVLPLLDAWLAAQEPGRVLLAGAPRIDLAVTLAQADHWVTVADLDEATVAEVHAGLAPKVAGRLTLVARDYGQASFAPASFDLVVMSDTLHTYQEPGWLLHKAQREVKPDGLVAVRALVKGDAATRAELQVRPAPLGLVPDALLERALVALEALAKTPAGVALLTPAALDAIERGALLQAERFAQEAAWLIDLVGTHLTVEEAFVGHTLRLRACDDLFGARPMVRQGLLQLLAQLPAAATTGDRHKTEPRVLGLVARRSLRRGTSSGWNPLG